MNAEYTNMVVAGFFPVRLYQDGTFEVKGSSKLSTEILDSVLTAILCMGSAVEKVSGHAIQVKFPVTPRNKALFVRFLRRLVPTA